MSFCLSDIIRHKESLVTLCFLISSAKHSKFIHMFNVYTSKNHKYIKHMKQVSIAVHTDTSCTNAWDE